MLAATRRSPRGGGDAADGCGGEAGTLGPATQAALARFQREHDLPPTGDPDSATVAKIQELHVT